MREGIAVLVAADDEAAHRLQGAVDASPRIERVARIDRGELLARQRPARREQVSKEIANLQVVRGRLDLPPPVFQVRRDLLRLPAEPGQRGDALLLDVVQEEAQVERVPARRGGDRRQRVGFPRPGGHGSALDQLFDLLGAKRLEAQALEFGGVESERLRPIHVREHPGGEDHADAVGERPRDEVRVRGPARASSSPSTTITTSRLAGLVVASVW